MSTELLPYFSVHMWKLTSYFWHGVWMNEDGSILPPQVKPEYETLTCVGEIKDIHYNDAKAKAAAILWEGGFRPGDSPDKARRILSNAMPKEEEVVEED